jgi:3-oxoacyl-[acyl-carrier protein] reductase
MHLLKGKKAIVTGGTAGIGREIAIQLAKQGASVAIFGTNTERAKEVLIEMQAEKIAEDQQFIVHIADVSQKSSVDECCKAILSSFGSVDILVNNAGITRDQLLMKMSEEDWDDVVKINLKSIYNLCQNLIRPMMKTRSGKIINISSVVGLVGNPGQTNYAASKAGIIGFSKALAQEVASRGICVNVIAPGYIKTRMTDQLTPEQQEMILKKVPLGRMGEPSDIAHACVFLASSMADYITGQVLVVDGGMVM